MASGWRFGHFPNLDFVIILNRGLHGVAAKVRPNIDNNGKPSFEIGPGVGTCKCFEILVIDRRTTTMQFRETK
jgi:hypothetical protein